jgi:hypothetical protein
MNSLACLLALIAPGIFGFPAKYGHQLRAF